MKPYIGITDFTSKQQVDAMLAVFKEAFPFGNRSLMVGTMMSYKTLNNLPTKWSTAFPKPEHFSYIYPSNNELLLNTLHYADYDGLTHPEDLTRAIMIAGNRGPFNPPTLNALQLDMIWPSVALIKEAISSAQSFIDESTKEEDCLKNLKVILQIGTVAMEREGNNPQRVAQRIAEYGNIVHCVLFDRSGGLGKSMESQLLRSYIIESKKVNPQTSIAVAGGLGPDTMDLVVPLVKEFPNISIDAQGKLRRSGNALNPIELDLVEMYIRESGKVFS